MKDKQQLFNELPKELQEKIKEDLLWFDDVRVWFENGKYHSTVHIMVRNKYSTDYKHIAEFTAKDVYDDLAAREILRAEKERFYKSLSYEELEKLYKTLS